MTFRTAPLRTAAVVGVAMFSNVAPDNFGVFDAAFLTLFYVTGGDPWPDALPKFNEDGSANWIVAAYIMAYTMIEIWVILQVPAGPAYACAEPATKRNMPVLCVEFDRFVLRRACVFRSDFCADFGPAFPVQAVETATNKALFHGISVAGVGRGAPRQLHHGLGAHGAARAGEGDGPHPPRQPVPKPPRAAPHQGGDLSNLSIFLSIYFSICRSICIYTYLIYIYIYMPLLVKVAFSSAEQRDSHIRGTHRSKPSRIPQINRRVRMDGPRRVERGPTRRRAGFRHRICAHLRACT